jgi:hypothetical protein
MDVLVLHISRPLKTVPLEDSCNAYRTYSVKWSFRNVLQTLHGFKTENTIAKLLTQNRNTNCNKV